MAGRCSPERPGRVDDDDSSDDKTSQNRAPIARARADKCILFGFSHELDGTTSSDPDGDDLDFDWDVINRPSGSDLGDADLFPDDEDDDPIFEPDRLGLGFALAVEDPDGASDTAIVETEAYIDIDLQYSSYVLDEGDTVVVKINLSDEAPQDVKVTLWVGDDVVVFVDDEGEEIPGRRVTIDAGDDEATVYLYGVEDGDNDDESTDITVSVESDDCPVRDSASVDVEDNDERDVSAFDVARRLQFFVIRLLGFRIL